MLSVKVSSGVPTHENIATNTVSIQSGGFADFILDVSNLGVRSGSGALDYPLNVTANPEGPSRVKESFYNNNSKQALIDARRLFSLEDISVSVFYVEQGISLGEGQLIAVEMGKKYSLLVGLYNAGNGVPEGWMTIARSCEGAHTDHFLPDPTRTF